MAKKKNITKKQNLKKKLGQTSASKKTEVSEPVSSGSEKAEEVLFAIEPIEDDLVRVAAAVTELEDIDSAKVSDEETISTQADALSKIDELPKYGGSPLTGEEFKQQSAKIVEGWHSMNGIDDLCVVLNMALQALHGMDAVKTTVGRLKLMARKGRYVTFKIPKKKK